jgi:hypothetical protein
VFPVATLRKVRPGASRLIVAIDETCTGAILVPHTDVPVPNRIRRVMVAASARVA